MATERDTQLVRVKSQTVAKLSEYLAKSGSSIAHVTTDALEDWIERKMPKLLKALER